MNIACFEIYRRKRASAIQKNAISLHISTVLIIFFQTQTFSKIFMLWENDRFIILNVRYFRHSKIFANIKVAKVFFVVFVVFVVFISNRCTSSWLSRSLWIQRIYEQVIEITYSVDRWEKKKQWVDRFETKLRKNEE